MNQFDRIDQEFKLHNLHERLQKEAASMLKTFKKNLIGGLATGTAAAAIAGLGAGVAMGVGKLKDTIVKNRAMKSMIEANPSLATKDNKQVSMAFNSLYHLNPDFATDPLVAGSSISRFLDRSEAGGDPYIDPQTAATIIGKKPTAVDPVLGAFIQAGSRPLPQKKTKPEPKRTLEDDAKLKQYEAVLRKSQNPAEVAFGASPSAPAAMPGAPAPNDKQRADALFAAIQKKK